jgi:hypothetical protein
MADPHNNYLERAESYERLKRKTRCSLGRFAGWLEIADSAERVSELEEFLPLALPTFRPVTLAVAIAERQDPCLVQTPGGDKGGVCLG